jgi:hypothetical protein
MGNNSKKKLTGQQQQQILQTLQDRFQKNKNRHKTIEWGEIKMRLEKNLDKLWSLYQMELTGGEPDVVDFNLKKGNYIFFDCSAESPLGRRSVCFDKEGWLSRKEHRPENNALDMAADMGIELLTEEQYRQLQQLGTFDAKTSSWIQTPASIRKLGGALFADYRYGTVFVYHNGAQSYYGSRGFRGWLKV